MVQYEPQQRRSDEIDTTGPFEGDPRVDGEPLVRVRVKPRHSGHDFDELQHQRVYVNGQLFTMKGQRRSFIGKVWQTKE